MLDHDTARPTHSPSLAPHTPAASGLSARQGWRLRYWIILGYAVPVILAIFSAGVVSNQATRLRAQTVIVNRRGQANAMIRDWALYAERQSQLTRGYLLQPDPDRERRFEEAIRRIDALEVTLEPLVADALQEQRLAELFAVEQRLEDINVSLIAQARRGDVEGAIAAWRTDTGRQQSEQIARLTEEFNTRQAELFEESMALEAAAYNTLMTTVWGSAIASLLIALAAGAWLLWSITQRMTATTSTLAASTSEIAATIEQQERTASQQAASVNETTTTMDELGASSSQSSEQAEAAATAAQRALELADGGTRAVDETLASMNSLRDKVGAIAEQILRLSEQTNQIGSISQLVSDLANQTNMLALNAAVEAVRAGEHGKGFAVVAAEIRKLADQSKQSAQKINDLVGDIQHAINSTVMVTDEGTKTVESGATIAQETATAFVGVADAVNNVVLSNQQISLNIRQQATAIAQVVQAMNAINQGAKETASGITQTKLGTQNLREATAALQEMV